ncbi:MAG TPA: SRPBCC domain-containing protein [Rhizomicrobium sp.]|nr:SRPBCC domain-containing protein [Rhizomicrobium sp.]
MSHQVRSRLILSRIYDVPVERVWRAWTEPAELAQWYVAGSDHVVHFCEADVRPGGTYRIGFAPPGKTPYIETGTYGEVVPLKRLAFEETVSYMGKALHTCATLVEMRDLGGRTELVITASGTDSWRTGEGWTPAMESLARHLEAGEREAG